VDDKLDNEDWFAMSKSVYAELRSVGFDSTYESGLRFLEWYCDRLRGEIRRAAVESCFSLRVIARFLGMGEELDSVMSIFFDPTVEYGNRR